MVGDPPRLDDVWLVSLDPTPGAEIQKTRPCLVVSPDESNRHLRTVIIAPMTTVATEMLPGFVGRRDLTDHA